MQLWFPANYVEEVSAAEDDVDASPLGSLQKGTIDLTGVTVGKQKLMLLLTWLLLLPLHLFKTASFPGHPA